jgi:hypothetical protein
MPTSEAQIRANQQNCLRSTGPKTPEGKSISRANGLKHGLSGSGVVIVEADRTEVERRTEALQAELAPKSCLGLIMVKQLATLSVRMERAAQQETSTLAVRVRHAAEDFDEARLVEAEHWFDTLADDPRRHVRKLRQSPEGIDLLLQAWEHLRDDLTRTPRPLWTAAHLERAENLAGYRLDFEPGSQIKTLWEAINGDFHNLSALQGDALSDEARQAWAAARMVERIEAEIAELEALIEAFDFKTFALDRAGAADRALFDPSREAMLARRYESEARRGFYQALKDLRKAEAEFAQIPEPEPAEIPEPSPPLASSRESTMTERSPEMTRPEIPRQNPRTTPSNTSEAVRNSDASPFTAGSSRIGMG